MFLAEGLVALLLFIVVLLALAYPLGKYMTAVYSGARTPLSPALDPLERGILRLLGPAASTAMDWRRHALAAIAFNSLGFLAVYALLRLQEFLPLNPAGMAAVAPHTAFNIAASFSSNTNWQNYGGESTLSYLTQMSGLAVQNFVSAATGMAVMAAVARGIGRTRTADLGNFWTDLVRGTI